MSDLSRTKILSLKLCRHRCIAQANSENPMDVAGPVFKMLTTLLQHDGLLSDKITTRYSLHHSTPTPSDKFCIQSERTITAEVTSCGIHGIPFSSRCLRSSYNTAFCLVGSDDTGSSTFVPMSVLHLNAPPQDTCFHVRSRFLTKIVHLLHTRVLPFRFNVIAFLTVFDPDEEIKNIVRTPFITSAPD